MVAADNFSGSAAIISHLITDHGKRRLFHIDGPPNSPDAGERRLALEHVLREHPRSQLIGSIQGILSVRSGEQAGENLLARHRGALPDAVVCANDQMAIGVLRAFAAGGVRVPDEVAVVGFDDIVLGSLYDPTLTTVHQPMRMLGERACARLLDRIADPDLSPDRGTAADRTRAAVQLRLFRRGRDPPAASLPLRPNATAPRRMAVAPGSAARPARGPHASEGIGGAMSFIVRRLVFYVVAAWVALTINFIIPRLVPGNAVESIMSKFPNLQPSAYRAIEAMLGVGHPGSIWHQYWAYLVDVSHLNLGTSSSEYPAQVSHPAR